MPSSFGVVPWKAFKFARPLAGMEERGGEEDQDEGGPVHARLSLTSIHTAASSTTPRAMSLYSGVTDMSVMPLSRQAMISAPKSTPSTRAASAAQADAADDAGGHGVEFHPLAEIGGGVARVGW